MKNIKIFTIAFLAIASLTLSSCLHIFEEVTQRADGSGTYKLTADLSEIKGMMDMVKSMAADSLAALGQDSQLPMEEFSKQIIEIESSISSIQGISNIKENRDTSTYIFSYSFDFRDAAALNSALRVINRQKFEKKTEDIFGFKKNIFTRFNQGDLGKSFIDAMDQGLEQAEEQAPEIDASMISTLETFFADMTYEQIYRFPDHIVKKTSNSLSTIEENGQVVKLVLRPFDPDQKKLNPSVATEIKLKKK